jgi:hypothetical protein
LPCARTPHGCGKTFASFLASTLIRDLPATVVGVEAREKVTAEDYEKVLIPAVETAEYASRDGQVRMRYVLGRSFRTSPQVPRGKTPTASADFATGSASPSSATPTGCDVRSMA